MYAFVYVSFMLLYLFVKNLFCYILIYIVVYVSEYLNKHISFKKKKKKRISVRTSLLIPYANSNKCAAPPAYY